jgi:hypothetical protein
MAVEVMATLVDVGMTMVAICNVGAIGMDCNDGGQGTEMVAKVMQQAEIVVLSMVMDLVAECIVIDYLGCRHCLLVLFMDLSKM